MDLGIDPKVARELRIGTVRLAAVAGASVRAATRGQRDLRIPQSYGINDV